MTFANDEQIIIVLIDSLENNTKILRYASNLLTESTKGFSDVFQKLDQLNSVLFKGPVTPFSELWNKLIPSTLNFGPHLLPLLQPTAEKVVEKFAKITHDYSVTAKNIQKNGRAMMASVKKYEEIKNKKYTAYQNAAVALKSTTNPKKVPELRIAFMSAQKEALAAHAKYNSKKSEIRVQFDEILNDFETLEFWRTESLKKAFNKVGGILARAADKIESGVDSFENKLNEVDVKSKILEVNSRLNFKQAETDDRFQFVPVPRDKVSLDHAKIIFAAELRLGGHLMTSIANYRGNVNELELLNGEVLCVLSGDGNDVLQCKNLNESVGLVSSAFLT